MAYFLQNTKHIPKLSHCVIHYNHYWAVCLYLRQVILFQYLCWDTGYRSRNDASNGAVYKPGDPRKFSGHSHTSCQVPSQGKLKVFARNLSVIVSAIDWIDTLRLMTQPLWFYKTATSGTPDLFSQNCTLVVLTLLRNHKIMFSLSFVSRHWDAHVFQINALRNYPLGIHSGYHEDVDDLMTQISLY